MEGGRGEEREGGGRGEEREREREREMLLRGPVVRLLGAVPQLAVLARTSTLAECSRSWAVAPIVSRHALAEVSAEKGLQSSQQAQGSANSRHESCGSQCRNTIDILNKLVVAVDDYIFLGVGVFRGLDLIPGSEMWFNLGGLGPSSTLPYP